MAKIRYIRVSTVEQNIERQLVGTDHISVDKTFIDKVSAKNMDRPQFKLMLDYIREGDIIYIHDFSRVARNLKELLELIELLTSKSVSLVSIKENLDSSTPQGKLMISVLGAIYEFERAILLERQREGIEIAKKKGKFKGRKKIVKPSQWNEIYEMYRTRQITGVEAMQVLKIKKNTFYKFVNEERTITNE